MGLCRAGPWGLHAVYGCLPAPGAVISLPFGRPLRTAPIAPPCLFHRPGLYSSRPVVVQACIRPRMYSSLMGLCRAGPWGLHAVYGCVSAPGAVISLPFVQACIRQGLYSSRPVVVQAWILRSWAFVGLGRGFSTQCTGACAQREPSSLCRSVAHCEPLPSLRNLSFIATRSACVYRHLLLC